MASIMRFDTLQSTTGNTALTVSNSGNINMPGSVIQVVQSIKTNVFSTTSTSYVDVSGLSVAITPKFSTSKILISGNISLGSSTTDRYSVFGKLLRNSTDIYIADADGNRDRGTFSYQMGGFEGPMSQHFMFLDSPNTTSETVYKIQIRSESPQTAYINRGLEADGNSSITPRTTSSITVMEISQ